MFKYAPQTDFWINWLNFLKKDLELLFNPKWNHQHSQIDTVEINLIQYLSSIFNFYQKDNMVVYMLCPLKKNEHVNYVDRGSCHERKFHDSWPVVWSAHALNAKSIYNQQILILSTMLSVALDAPLDYIKIIPDLRCRLVYVALLLQNSTLRMPHSLWFYGFINSTVVSKL